MQSTGHSSMQDLSLTSMHGSLMVYVIFGLTPLWARSSHWWIPPGFPGRQTLTTDRRLGPGVTPLWATRLGHPADRTKSLARIASPVRRWPCRGQRMGTSSLHATGHEHLDQDQGAGGGPGVRPAAHVYLRAHGVPLRPRRQPADLHAGRPA